MGKTNINWSFLIVFFYWSERLNFYIPWTQKISSRLFHILSGYAFKLVSVAKAYHFRNRFLLILNNPAFKLTIIILCELIYFFKNRCEHRFCFFLLLLHYPPQAKHKQDTDGGSKGIVNHIIEFKQAAITNQLGQFNQHGNIAVWVFIASHLEFVIKPV